MIPDVGRGVALLASPEGKIYTFFNSPLTSWDEIVYEGTSTYRMVFSSSDYGIPYRALHYLPYYSSGPLDEIPRLVPFINEQIQDSDSSSETERSEVITPLWETIDPSVAKVLEDRLLSLVFWTNLTEAENSLESLGSTYIYDVNKVLRFDNSLLDDVDFDAYSIKMLCAAEISWERFRVSGYGASGSEAQLIPVIRRVHVLLMQTGNIVTDFGGGGGSGMRRHNHADNYNCGFAYGTFAPGTSLQLINWRKV